MLLPALSHFFTFRLFYCNVASDGNITLFFKYDTPLQPVATRLAWTVESTIDYVGKRIKDATIHVIHTTHYGVSMPGIPTYIKYLQFFFRGSITTDRLGQKTKLFFKSFYRINYVLLTVENSGIGIYVKKMASNSLAVSTIHWDAATRQIRLYMQQNQVAGKIEE